MFKTDLPALYQHWNAASFGVESSCVLPEVHVSANLLSAVGLLGFKRIVLPLYLVRVKLQEKPGWKVTGGHGKSAKITLKMALPGLGFQSCSGKQAVPSDNQEQDEAWDVAACSSICRGSELFLHPVSTASPHCGAVQLGWLHCGSLQELWCTIVSGVGREAWRVLPSSWWHVATGGSRWSRVARTGLLGISLYEVDFCTLYGNVLGRGLSPKDQQQDTCNALRAPV